MVSETKCQDPNMIRPEGINKPDVRFYSPLEEPFAMYGMIYEDNRYLRMPKAIAENVSEGVRNQSQHTSGGRICFKTNSPYIALSCKCYFYWETSIVSLSGSHGFEVQVRDGKTHKFQGLFVPKYEKRNEFAAVVEMPKDGEEREVIIYFPSYTGVSEAYIGLSESASLSKWSGYTYEKPMVFYGSSITHGVASSMPGNCYVTMLSRYFDSNFINLGMAGHCKAEPNMMEYIASLDMSMFVYDYDHNAPTADFLESTHYAGYLKFRETNADTPIILTSRPNLDDFNPKAEPERRRNIILATYEKALAAGDKNVTYADGKEIYSAFCKSGFAADNVHPNDIGFYHMAKVYAPYIQKYLK